MAGEGMTHETKIGGAFRAKGEMREAIKAYECFYWKYHLNVVG